MSSDYGRGAYREYAAMVQSSCDDRDLRVAELKASATLALDRGDYKSMRASLKESKKLMAGYHAEHTLLRRLSSAARLAARRCRMEAA